MVTRFGAIINNINALLLENITVNDALFDVIRNTFNAVFAEEINNNNVRFDRLRDLYIAVFGAKVDNNDDLVDYLKEYYFIRTSTVEKVFRAVDRGSYFPAVPATNPYKDVAWKKEKMRISAPCVYSEVMERLRLKPGLSFLNLGSGTGYLSTMAGLILGHNGINRGIELHDDLIQYAQIALARFKKSEAVVMFDFCEPTFIHGNGLRLDSGGYLYDRVYCGAQCPVQYLDYLKNLIKVGGILIVPIEAELLQIRRTSKTNWRQRRLLPAIFDDLVEPAEDSGEVIQFPAFEPQTLQGSCRIKIRKLLRESMEQEYPLAQQRAELNRLKNGKTTEEEANGTGTSRDNRSSEQEYSTDDDYDEIEMKTKEKLRKAHQDMQARLRVAARGRAIPPPRRSEKVLDNIVRHESKKQEFSKSNHAGDKTRRKLHKRSYYILMRRGIRKLPLPALVKKYLLFKRQ